MTTFLQQVLNGLTVGAVYSLVAVGYTLVYGVLRLMNFAHGSIYTLGAYLGYTALVLLHAPLWTSLIFAIVVTGIAGAAVERIGYYPVRKAPVANQIVSVFGLAIVLDNLIMLVWGAQPRALPRSEFLSRTFSVGSFKLSIMQIAIFGTALLIMLLLSFLVYRTKPGLAMRATALNAEASALMGIRVERLRVQVFVLSAMLAAIAGLMVGLYYHIITFNTGLGVVIKAFVISILGGIGNVPGAILGGFLLAQVESLGGAYISTGYKDAFAYIVMILVLLFRPNGLLGQVRAENV